MIQPITNDTKIQPVRKCDTFPQLVQTLLFAATNERKDLDVLEKGCVQYIPRMKQPTGPHLECHPHKQSNRKSHRGQAWNDVPINNNANATRLVAMLND